MRILLSAYACEPGRGSEPGVGWGWATELARAGHRLWVLTRTDNRATIERDTRASGPGLKFIYYDLPEWFQRWRRFSAVKPLYYILWQWGAARHIRKRFPELPFDVVHHVTYVSVRYPSFMGSLGIPFYFGPVAGGETVPHGLRTGFSIRQRWLELVRDVSNLLVPLDPMMRSVFKHADKLFVMPDTLALIPARFRRKCEIRLPVYLATEYLCKSAATSKRSALSLLYAGRLVDWKGADIALHAVHRLRQFHPDVHFTIVGDGPARASFCKLAEQLGLSGVVEWVGWLPQSALEELYRTAHVMLFPSLRDAGATVVVEALAHGLPVVCAGLGGPRVIVNERCGRVIPVPGKSREELATDLADAVREIMTTPGLWDSLSAGARQRAREFDFQNLVRAIYPDAPCPAIAEDHDYGLPLCILVPPDAAL